MKFAISNIAWEEHADPKVLSLLKRYNIEGIEVAPTKIWHDWQGANFEEASSYKDMMSSKGFVLPALQAILFGKPELQVFDRSSHDKFIEHFKMLSEIAAGFECKTLVFGSPKNRKRNSLSYSESIDIAIELFYKIGETLKGSGAVLGIEANPVEYSCDFLTNLRDVKEFTDKVDSLYIQPHVDSAAVYMCSGEIKEELKMVGNFCHFHISEPMLAPLSEGVVDHKNSLIALRDIGYDKWISIEMKQPETPNALEESLQLISKEL